MHQYILTHVIEKIQHLLKDPNRSLKGIAQDLNYSVPHLNRMFKRKTGFTPQAYRNHIANNANNRPTE